MKTLRNLSLILALAAFTLTGCKKEGCTDAQSDNYDSEAKKDDGTCKPWRDKFIGSFSAQESCTQGNFNYTLSITSSSASGTSVVLNNFYGVGASVVGTVNANSITIANQTVTVQGTAVNFSGSGQISGNILTLTYTASVAGVADSCTATCTKQ